MYRDPTAVDSHWRVLDLALNEPLLDLAQRVFESLAVTAGSLRVYDPARGFVLDEKRMVGTEALRECKRIPASRDADLEGRYLNSSRHRFLSEYGRSLLEIADCWQRSQWGQHTILLRAGRERRQDLRPWSPPCGRPARRLPRRFGARRARDRAGHCFPSRQTNPLAMVADLDWCTFSQRVASAIGFYLDS